MPKTLTALMLATVSCISYPATATDSTGLAGKFTATCEVHFSPNGGAQAAIVNKIKKAKTSILMQSYSFTSKPIVDALIAAHDRGVDVQLIIDSQQKDAPYNLVDYAAQGQLDVLLDKKHQIAHNKIIIIDSNLVHTGSFNFSGGAELRNAENSVWCKSVAAANLYTAEFEVHKEHSEAYVSK